MEQTDRIKSSLSIPLAIIVAGALIAGAVLISRGGPTSSAITGNQGTVTDNSAQTTQEISIKPIAADDHALGNPAASLAIVVYTDLECPFCKTFHATMQRIADSYGKDGSVLWVYRHFPLEQLHPKAPKEAEATECASELGGKTAFWDFTNKLFEITPSNNGLDSAELPEIAESIGINKTAFNTCLSSGKYADKIQNETQEAVNAGGRGTPYSVIVSKTAMSDQKLNTIKGMIISFPPDTFTFSTDKKRIGMSGALPYTFVKQLLDTILAN